MTSLDSRNYVATIEDIAAITKAYSASLDTGRQTRGTYFRALIATTQAEMGSKPRLRNGADEEPTLSKDEIALHLSSLEAVHARFYEAVLSVVSGDADERNRKSGFARSSVSTLRAYVRAGFDIRLLAAARATKAAVADKVPAKNPRARSLPVLRKQAERLLDQLDKIGTAVAKADKAMAVEVLEGALTRIAGRLATMGNGRPVTDAARAVRDHVPLKTPAGTFYPMQRGHA